MDAYSVQQVEVAINWWTAEAVRKRGALQDGEAGALATITLCREASKLATPYAEMIVERAMSFPRGRFSEEVVMLLEKALHAVGDAAEVGKGV